VTVDPPLDVIGVVIDADAHIDALGRSRGRAEGDETYNAQAFKSLAITGTLQNRFVV
jgi:hypothetical protein